MRLRNPFRSDKGSSVAEEVVPAEESRAAKKPAPTKETPRAKQPAKAQKATQLNSKKATPTKKENRLVRYFREVRAELQKVVWPTRREALNLTAIVLGVTTTMSIGLGLVDWIFSRLFAFIIR